jgi:hypothetical protein
VTGAVSERSFTFPVSAKKQGDLNPDVTRAAEGFDSGTGSKTLMPPFAASFFRNFRQIKRIWRKHVGVECNHSWNFKDLRGTPGSTKWAYGAAWNG